jgi:hypothetical protein
MLRAKAERPRDRVGCNFSQVVGERGNGMTKLTWRYGPLHAAASTLTRSTASCIRPWCALGQSRPAARSPVDLLPRWVRPSSDRLRLRRPKHPQWYYNLKAHPQCQFGDERFVATEVTDPDEYVRLVALAEKVYAGYGDYRAKTASVGRQIPIFRLKPC